VPIARRPLPRAAVSRAWLDVPYSDRHLVKKLGALWDPAARRWYAPVPGLPALRPWRRLPRSLPGEDRGYGQGLYADPIPASSWYRNVRSAVSARDWYRISQMTRRRAGWACESCGWQPDRADRDLLDAHRAIHLRRHHRNTTARPAHQPLRSMPRRHPLRLRNRHRPGRTRPPPPAIHHRHHPAPSPHARQRRPQPQRTAQPDPLDA
jgi:hypothetical protein